MNSALFKFFLYCLKCMNASRWNKWPSFHPMRLVVISMTRSAPIVKDITQLYRYYRHAWWQSESHGTWWSYHACTCWLFKGFWHNCLCNHFEKTSSRQGFSKSYLKWVSNYLTGRKQYVQIEDRGSQKIDDSFGVPQESILGTVLFSLFVNDVSDHLGRSVRSSMLTILPFTRTTSLQILRYVRRSCN